MSLALQPKLLRVLQNGEYYRVGSRRLAKTDVRLVCASNQAMEELVEKGQFRRDLYYRINTVRIDLPALRQRMEDLPALADLFLAKARQRDPALPSRWSPAALQCMMDYRWPGNVRELQHMVERAALVTDGDVILPSALPEAMHGKAPQRTAAVSEDLPFKEARKSFEHGYFTRLLERCHHNVQKAAEEAGLHRSTLYEKLASLGIATEAH
jgi:DNA-binding NtrC family response regulator